MRILSLRLANLNSLMGEWHIDFSHPTLVANGCFAIIGPTGSGKTTLLDAICLALYGQTPRLGKITQSNNELMSQQASHCFAEVTFETQAGRYRCFWSQQRARKKKDGALQVPKHEIAKWPSGDIIDASLKGVLAHIERVTGMDFKRFTRSMMLAQGEFASFLLAPPDERAPILEQITGSDIYSQISMMVHQRHRMAVQALKDLEMEIAGVTPLSPEQEAQLNQQLTACDAEINRLQASQITAQQGLDWLAQITRLQVDLINVNEALGHLHQQRLAFLPKRESLGLARTLQPLESDYATLQVVRQEQRTDQHRIQGLLDRHNQLGESMLPLQRKVTEAQCHFDQLTVQHQQRIPLLQQVKELDRRMDELTQQQQSLFQAQGDFIRLESSIQTDLNKARTNQITLAQSIQKLDHYLQTHAEDHALVTQWTGIYEQSKAVFNQHTHVQHKQKALKDEQQAEATLSQEWEAVQVLSNQHQKTLAGLRAEHQQAIKHFQAHLGGQLLREIRTKKDHLIREQAYQLRMIELETMRSQLQDGVPCPLCGAPHHPYQQQTPGTAVDALQAEIDTLTQRIATAEQLEDSISQLATMCQEATDQWNVVTAQQESLRQKIEWGQSHRLRLEQDCNQAQQAYQELATQLAAQLAPFGVSDLTESEVLNLQARRDQWIAVGQQRELDRQKQDAHELEMAQFTTRLEATQSQRQSMQPDLDKLTQEIHENRQVRQQLLGDRDPDSELKKGQDGIQQAEDQLRVANSDLEVAQKYQLTVWGETQGLQASIQDRAQRLHGLEQAWRHRLEGANIRDEAHFLEGLLSESVKQEWELLEKTLDSQWAGLQTNQQSIMDQLAQEKARALTPHSESDLATMMAQIMMDWDVQRDLKAQIHVQLTQHQQASERIKMNLIQIQAQQKEVMRWGNLHELIGSENGKKYRNFAQGLTFEWMIMHANEQLQRMTDRYTLINDDQIPLGLAIMDHYQAGESRSTKNMSGGEQFLVSLALALGLSKMASQTVRVDSLFLDEGFGTLDHEALDLALSTLSSLHHDGKVVGIISHVGSIKEWIPSKIQVHPVGLGRSELSGVGVSRGGGD